MARILTRDEWLTELAKMMRPAIKRLSGVVIPVVPITAENGAMLGKTAQGFCTYGTKKSHARIVVSADVIDPAMILAHELLHAGMPLAGHDWTYQGAAGRLGLDVDGEGYTVAGPLFKSWAQPLVDRLPPYPGPALRPAPNINSPFPTRAVVFALYAMFAAFLAWVVWPLPDVQKDPDFTRTFCGFLLALAGLLYVVTGCVTDSELAYKRTARRVAQAVLLAGPPLVGFAAIWLFGVSPVGSFAKIGEADEAFAFQLLGFTLVTAGAYVFALMSVGVGLWRDRPFARFYRLNGFIAPTPKFLLHQPLFTMPGSLWPLSRSNPDHLGRALELLQLAALAERVRIGHLLVDERQQRISANLLDASGFVIEETAGGYVVATSIKGKYSDDDLKAMESRGLSNKKSRARGFNTVPVLRPTLIHVSIADATNYRDPLAPPSTEKGGARFAWPFS